MHSRKQHSDARPILAEDCARGEGHPSGGGGTAAHCLTDFVRQHSLNAPNSATKESEHSELSKRDSLRVLALLKNPPKPNAKLLRSAKLLSKRK
jgi:hypothetical protein